MSTLEKIRAEIDVIEINGQVDEHTAFIRTGEHVKQMALDIIDKYAEQEPYDDAVSRQAVLDSLHSKFADGFDSDRWWNSMSVLYAINKVPSVRPQEQTGHWKHREDMDYLDKNKVMHEHFMCQNCGFIHDFIDGHTAQYKYCPNCRARMVEPQESENKECI